MASWIGRHILPGLFLLGLAASAYCQPISRSLQDILPSNATIWCQSPTGPLLLQPCRQPNTSGSLTDASASALTTTATIALSACGTVGAGAGGIPASGCASTAGRNYLGFSNQNNLSGTNGNLCIGFGTAPNCTPGSGSLILAPGQGWTFEGTETPPDSVQMACSTGTCAAWVKSQ